LKRVLAKNKAVQLLKRHCRNFLKIKSCTLPHYEFHGREKVAVKKDSFNLVSPQGGENLI